MHSEVRRAILPKEIRSLILFDHKAFADYPADWFSREEWEACDPWWMIVGNVKVGCCAFEPHRDFQEDIGEDGKNAYRRGSLYIVTTGILPSYRGLGFGYWMKLWQVLYARRHGFTRIVTNTRQSNRPMIRLNEKAGFRVLRVTADYYGDPVEPAVVMELQVCGGAG